VTQGDVGRRTLSAEAHTRFILESFQFRGLGEARTGVLEVKHWGFT
jgi:hypothetical protein